MLNFLGGIAFGCGLSLVVTSWDLPEPNHLWFGIVICAISGLGFVVHCVTNKF